MKTYKKTFIIILLLVFSVIGGVCFSQERKLEVTYPQLPSQAPGIETPTTIHTALPEYIKYIFTWIIIGSGILAFGALVYGGIRYLTSGGDPSKMNDGKNQIVASLLGIVILLSSYLILNTINPQLVVVTKPTIFQVSGVRIYTVDNCCKGGSNEEDCKAKNSLRVPPQGIKNLKDLLGNKQIKSIEFLGNPGEVTVYLESGTSTTSTIKIDYPVGDNQSCKPVSHGDYHSIYLDWHLPGVYLYSERDCEGAPKIYQVSSATLPDFDDKTKSIKILYKKNPQTGKTEEKYGVVLHENENYQGACALLEAEENECINLSELSAFNDPSNNKGVDLTDKVSSITIYSKLPEGWGGVRFYEHKNYGGCPTENPAIKGDGADGDGYFKDDTFVSDVKSLANQCNCDENCNNCNDCDDKISSIEIRGHYIAVLFENPDYTGLCEVFKSSDPNFRNNRIGQCPAYFGIARKDCLSSFIVKAGR